VTDLLVATANPGKAREIKALLPTGFNLLTLADFPEYSPAEETGDTLAGNAREKALAASKGTGVLTLAEDSGLEVDALGGAPGVHSARYAGPDQDSRKNIQRLLRELEGVPEQERSARFRCVAVLAVSGKLLAEEEGVLEGRIALSPRGVQGFGYDPVFIPEGNDRTLAELTPEEKNRLSHRGRALSRLVPSLERLFSASEAGTKVAKGAEA